MQLEYVQHLEARVRELEARLATPPPPPTATATTPMSTTPTAPETVAETPPKRSITRKPQAQLAPRLHAKPKPAAAAAEESFAGADSSRWEFKEVRYGGAYRFSAMGRKELCSEEIAKGVDKFKAAPHKYAALWYQASMVDFPAAQQKYTLVHRAGTKGFEPQNVSDAAAFTCVTAQYRRLQPLADLGQAKDRYTDEFNYQGYLCAAAAKPGRGDGVGDVPGLKLWSDVEYAAPTPDALATACR